MSGRTALRVATALAALALLALAAPAAPAAAQSSSPTATTPAPAATAQPPSVTNLAKQLADERSALERERAALAARGEASAVDDVGVELDAIDKTLGTLSEYEAVLAAQAELAEREASPAAGPVVDLGARFFDLAALERVQDALASVTARRDQLEHNRKVSAEELAATRDDFEKREETRRKAREAVATLDPTTDPAAAVAARRALRLAELESRRTELRRDLLAKVTEVIERQAALLGTEEEAVRAALGRVRADLRIGPDELGAQMAKLDLLEAELTREQERVQTRIAERETRLARSQRALEARTEKVPALAAEVSAYRSELQAEKYRESLLNERQSHVSASRELWRERSRVLRGELARDALRTRALELAQSLDESARGLRIQQARLAQIRSDAEQARADAREAVAEGRPTAPWKEREARALEEAIAALERNAKSLADLRALQQRASDDVTARVEVSGWRRPLQATVDGIAGLWGRELTSVDDHPITVGKIVVALAVLLVGWGAARAVAHLVARLMRGRSGAAEGAVRAIESLTFYALLALFFLVALRTVNIPLTAFALAGGALAVGIGFGSQAVVNNFISGLILLTERPIQIGDIIEIDGTQGVVERIGPRSTRIRTFEGIHLIVPNSAFLERNVVNLTLSDDPVRGMVSVGVAYSADPREVQTILERVLEEHTQVLDAPAAVTELAAFGESALVFNAVFWVRDVTQRGKVASDVRHRLAAELRRAGIALASPQREVHLDARAAVPVRLVREGPGPGAGE